MSNMPAVLDAIAGVERTDHRRREENNKYTTENGIVFRLKPVPPLLIVDAQKLHREPVPPKVYIQDKDTHEENPNDPEYQRQLNEWRQTVGEISNAVLLTRGTEIISVPAGIDQLDDPAWAEDLFDLTGLEVPKVGRRRYFCWMKYVALTSMDDFQGIVGKISRLGGITMEADVADAEARFRSDEEGYSANGVHAAEEAVGGDSDASTGTGSGT